MKKLSFFCLILLGVFMASCEYQQPQVSFTASQYTLSVGDSAVLEVYNANRVDFQYSDTRNVETPVFEMSNRSDSSITIHALNPGIDTLWLSYGWNQSIYAYGHTCAITINVVE
jgi:hypothetical protein